MKGLVDRKQWEQLKCFFCGKSKWQVEKLVADPGVCICSECIELYSGVIRKTETVESGEVVGA